MDSSAVLRNFVGGEYVDTVDGETTPLVDPCTEEEVGSAGLSRWADVDGALRRAESAQETWAGTTPADRQRALLKLADSVEDAAADFVFAECAMTGKPVRQVVEEELPQAVDQIRFFAGAARVLDGTAGGEYLAGHASMLHSEPLGVCAQVTPHSHPLVFAASSVAPALAAGNAVVLKPAETTPTTSLLLAEHAAAVLPPGVFNVICGDRDTGRAMVAHETPRLIALTGAVRSGMEVAGSAAGDLKRVHLRLGGKAPAVVFADVDVPDTAARLVRAAFANGGQDCLSATRVLAADAVYDELLAEIAARAEALRTGPPQDVSADYGPLNNAVQFDQVNGVLQRLPDHAEVLTTGGPTGSRGYFVRPTVIAGVEQDDEVVQNEVFGPVLTVQRFTDVEDALLLANGVRYGRAASVWTADNALAARVASALSFGSVWVNTHGSVAAEMPHNGFRHSGHGTGVSRHGLDDYTRFKHVMTSLKPS
ncbi:Gamma-aminobutyraldehyde dehydrogenase [Actinoalloteichus hoggarensis]|uniref:Gamma-aminobutyraldehyde dehydrogenase n=1 Tax=Actinoalloteichus hoggarensis TaxID=1470176 RepID=A0A221W224_9PSEU|nr:Gamma-aminobutyraldehyde dehydrogenase [Actinoalloteichus hoggarensis]